MPEDYTWLGPSIDGVGRTDTFQAPAPRDGSVQTEPDTTSKDIHPRRIFFSYGHDANRELVDRLKEDLEKRGHQVWIDYKEIGTWDNWRGKITSGIYKSQMAVAFLSIHSTRDPGVCRNEIAMALHYFGTVYPVMMENVPSESIPSTITHLQWLDFSPWKELRREPDPLAFERFYEERFLEIVSRVEGEATRFASEASVLRQVLRPSQFDAKFAQHLEGFIGRQWCFEAFESWLNHQPDSRVFLVSAGPGFGKTALAVNLANRFRGAVVGTWFCDSKSGELSDPLQAVRTLAFQLALRWDDYRTRLLPRLGLHAGSGEAQVREALETLSKKKLKDLFTLLLAEPMVDLIWREHKLVILVDGLDEATLQSEGCNELAALISGEFLELPKWVGFAVTSRPEALVSGHLQRFKPFEIAAGDVRNDEDLRTCVEQRIMEWGPLSKLPEMKRARIAGVLVAKSAGMVLYLRMVEDGLKEGALRVEQLENMESGLVGLFSHYYQSFGQRYGIAGYADSVQPLFRLLMAAPGPLPLELAGGVLGVSREEAYRLRVLLGSYAVDAQNGVALFHKTLGEWLASRSAGPFYTDAASGEEALGKWLWECFEQRRKNEHGITDPLEWETPVLDWLPKMLVAINKNEDSDALTALAGLLHERCRWDGAQALYSKALEVKKKALGPNHPNTLKSGSELGILFRDKGDYQTAETLFREVLSAREMALGPEHLDTFESRHNLGRVLQAQGDPEEAEVHFQRALIGREKLLGEAHPDTLQTVNNLGHLLRVKGSYKAAEALYRRSLEGRKKTLGPEHPQTLTSLHNLGILLFDQGDYNGAEALYHKALEGREKALGPEHPHTLWSVSHLGDLLEAKGDYKKAEALQRRALEGRIKALGSTHLHTLYSLNNLGNLLCKRGDYEGAAPLYQEALAGREKALGSEHPDTLVSVNNLGTLLRDKGDYQGAETVLRKALIGREKALGTEHPDTLQSAHNLGRVLQATGDYDGAEALFRRALLGREKSLGPEHPETLQSVNNLGHVLRSKGLLEMAEMLYRRSLEGRIRTLGPEHPQTLTSMHNLGILLFDTGDYAGAEDLYQKALAGRKKVLGPAHPHTLWSMSHLGDLLEVRGDLVRAEAIHREVLEGRKKILGTIHPHTLCSMRNLGNLLYKKGSLEAAEPLWLEALQGREKTLGPEHPETLQSVRDFGGLLCKKGDYPAAIEFLRIWTERSPVCADASHDALARVEIRFGPPDRG